MGCEYTLIGSASRYAEDETGLFFFSPESLVPAESKCIGEREANNGLMEENDCGFAWRNIPSFAPFSHAVVMFCLEGVQVYIFCLSLSLTAFPPQLHTPSNRHLR